MMKTKIRFATWLVVVVTCALVAAQSALAFYNPQTGRWLSRDPLAEFAFNSVSGFEFASRLWWGFGGNLDTLQDNTEHMNSWSRRKKPHGVTFCWVVEQNVAGAEAVV